eukprot:763521-Hanusia_phi.AAC.18
MEMEERRKGDHQCSINPIQTCFLLLSYLMKQQQTDISHTSIIATSPGSSGGSRALSSCVPARLLLLDT